MREAKQNICQSPTDTRDLDHTSDETAQPRTRMRSAKVAIAAVLSALCMLVVASALILATPKVAYAKTIAEFDAEIAAQEQVVSEKQAALDQAKKVLAEATTWYYKNLNTDAIGEIMTGQRSIAETIDQISFIDALYQSYSQKVQASELAKKEAAEASEALSRLKSERMSRSRSIEASSSIQFAQGGMPEWSGLRYWNGNIGTSGCGLCAYTVIIDVLCGKDYTPADMHAIRGDWRGMDGYPEDRTGSKIGTHHDFTLSEFDVETWNISNSLDELKSALRERESAAMVCSQGRVFKNRSGVYRWSGGHFVAVIGYDEQGFHVSDSAYSKDEGANVIYSDAEMRSMLSNASKVTIYSN